MKIRFRLRLCSLVLVLLLIIPNIAYAAEYDNKDISVQDEITPRVMYIKELLRYDSTVNKTNWTYKLVGSVSGNNLKNPYTKLHLDFAYNTSGSVSASLGVNVTGSLEKKMVLGKMKVSAGVTFAESRSWTSGKKYSAGVDVPPSKFGILRGYVPGHTTSGSLVYKVCNLDYPNNWWTETKVVNNAFAPAESHIHTTMEVYNYVP